MNNSGITLIEVRSEAMDAIKKLKTGAMDVKTASEIRNLLGIVVDTAKTQVEFMKALPNSIKEKMDIDSIKAIAGTLRDKDAEMDETMIQINKSKNKVEIG